MQITFFQDEMADIWKKHSLSRRDGEPCKKYRRLDPLSQKIVLSIIEMELNRTPSSDTEETPRKDRFIPENCIFYRFPKPASAGTGVYLAQKLSIL